MLVEDPIKSGKAGWQNSGLNPPSEAVAALRVWRNAAGCAF